MLQDNHDPKAIEMWASFLAILPENSSDMGFVIL